MKRSSSERAEQAGQAASPSSTCAHKAFKRSNEGDEYISEAADINGARHISSPQQPAQSEKEIEIETRRKRQTQTGEEEGERELLYFIIHKPREVLSDRIDSQVQT